MQDYPGPENREPDPGVPEPPEMAAPPTPPEPDRPEPSAVLADLPPLPLPPELPLPPAYPPPYAADAFGYAAPQPAPQPVRAAAERTRSGRVLISCGVAIVVSLIMGMAALSILGVHTDRAENGVLRFWVGPMPEVVITSAPAPTHLAAASEPPAITEPPAGEIMRAEDVYAKAAPGVVGILSLMDRSGATGSGMILREDGYILTNHHVVEDARSVTVILTDGTELDARIIGSDFLSDIAVLKVDRTGLPTVELGSSDAMVTGAKCYAIGNPLGMEFQNTFTDGMISAINRDITLNDPYRGDVSMTVLQTNCAVNPGNSGGPLLNDRGQVIGIVSSKIMGDYFTSTVEGLGFAIPVDTAIPIINSLIEHGRVVGRPRIGIIASPTQLDEQQAADLNLPLGVVIGEVERGFDAYRKGLQIGDIITHVEGEEVRTVAEINQIKNRFRAGDTLTLTVYRQGTVMEFQIILGEDNG